MDQIITQIIEVVLIPVLGALTVYIVAWLRAKAKAITKETDNETFDKYMNMLTEIICNCVVATNQTYVESLKQQGRFDVEAQKIAFQKTYDAVYKLLTDEAKKCIEEGVGDLEKYIVQAIEAEVNTMKLA